MVEFDDNVAGHYAKIKVVGVGGGGSNAVNRMIKNMLDGVESVSYTHLDVYKRQSHKCRR